MDILGYRDSACHTRPLSSSSWFTATAANNRLGSPPPTYSMENSRSDLSKLLCVCCIFCLEHLSPILHMMGSFSCFRVPQQAFPDYSMYVHPSSYYSLSQHLSPFPHTTYTSCNLLVGFFSDLHSY